MKIFHSINSFQTNKKTIVTLGTFDGVHIGHQKIIEKLIHNAKTSNCESLILTFFPHPRMVLQEQSEIQLLNTIEERTALLQKTGLDNLIIHPFDKTFSRLTAEEFVKDVLVDQLNIQKIVIGHDHRFGRNRTANIDDLIEFGEKYGFEVEQISAQEIEAVSVSSTKIRSALDAGNINLANQYLGYDYFLTGVIRKGKQLGRTIGFPTANLKIEENYKLVPQKGVYIVLSILDGKTVYGMMNIGINPTVGGESVSIEIYFLDFNGDLYDQKIQVSLLQLIRSEEKFASIDLLKAQLEKDKNTVITFLKNL
ncbi:bifunctional riboflavin kinase/FAD synthetase [Flavobacterium sp.]|uniref:bifunctional riboflavin kinase/FAD synthetase n=1 Tax=Flavobacterium sp. TaxID=239 RepID=UPI00286B871C|nr:bifunctional riboflavin kinase/FAD synthetase [Flavobacterium sp.]